MRTDGRKGLHRSCIATLATLVMLVTALTAGPASGYPEDANSGTCGSDIAYNFKDTSVAWTPTLEAEAAAGFEMMDNIVFLNGDQRIDIREAPVSGFDVVDILLTPAPGGDSDNRGWTLACVGANTIELRDDLYDPNDPDLLLKKTAAHEMGHVLHLNHTLPTNSFLGWGNGTLNELISECMSDTQRANSHITLDEAGSITKQWEAGGSQDYLHANGSFEQNTWSPPRGWVEVNNVVATTQIDSTADLGDHVMRVSPSHPTQHQIRQRMNLFDEVDGLDVEQPLDTSTPLPERLMGTSESRSTCETLTTSAAIATKRTHRLSRRKPARTTAIRHRGSLNQSPTRPSPTNFPTSTG